MQSLPGTARAVAYPVPMSEPAVISIVDSHTEGEPTRVVIAGAPMLAGRTVREMAEDLAARHDWFRSAVVCEPRGNEVLVGALLVPSADPTCATGVIYFNCAGVLGMCGHGTIGLVRTLAHLGRLAPGPVRIETPVGVVVAQHSGESIGIEVANVRSFVHRADVTLRLDEGRTVHGDIAWGGNGFFICEDHGEAIELGNLQALNQLACSIHRALARDGLSTVNSYPVDHVELIGAPRDPRNHGRSFVYCPGGAYDRSPCGTGTSAKLACLAAHGTLAPGDVWRQESLIGSVFDAWYAPSPEGGVMPTIRGRAWITAQGTLLLDPTDPYRHGIVPSTVR